MDHADLYLLRETYNQKHILLCFNGAFSQGLIEEIGIALRSYLQTGAESASPSAASDVFAVYIEIAQNIQHYSANKNYSEVDSSATVVIGREPDGHYVIVAGNVVEPEDGPTLVERVEFLAGMDKAQLRAAYKEQLRKPREETLSPSAGLGLIDIARKASQPVSCSIQPTAASTKQFFSLRVVI